MSRRFYILCAVAFLSSLAVTLVTYKILLPEYQSTYIEPQFMRIGLYLGSPCFFYILGMLVTAPFKNILPKWIQNRLFTYVGIAIFSLSVAVFIAFIVADDYQIKTELGKNLYYLCLLNPAIFLIPGMLTCLGLNKHPNLKS